ncbi:hypothetical protein O6H91_02G068600 [Diphasiastrum complanatum]|uniref:Uncharacterized protein n=2 Tax=Diphasiastrum complanatum TaxID=34168 RepID=A0ACC2EGR1_DIPCM|nr:hypothetical protein O6H91_02G068600 [Diphasiastrum complanatum]KAJ7565642.1 hypothetical protein O6H91_02G068600 [Diphasiastrum complanatum]
MAESTCTCWLVLGRAISSCWGFGKGRCCTRSSKQIVQPEFPSDGTQPNGKVVSSDVAGSIPSTPKVADEIRQASHLRIFAFSDLRAATRNFRPDSKLGVGGFGSVFKGWIDEHGTSAVKPGTGLTVAVKQLNHEGPQGHREWLAEVNFLGQFHHPNLVKLIGYCIEDDHRLLVYEFMPRGSLENHLFRHGVLPLPWAIRIKIAFGAAKGLAFLHGAKNPVIYRDFKTSNILLDSEYNAKLSDFGLAKDGPEGDKTHVSTRVMGTYGYAAPEYVMTGHLTSRSDVYSFGVVLLELLTGRRSMDKSRPSGEHNLVEWARPFLNDKRKVFRLVDHRLDGQYPLKGVQKAAALAIACLSRDAKSRPLMSEVVTSLEPLQIMKDAQGNFHYHQTANGMKDRHRFNSVANSIKHQASYQGNNHHQQNALGRLNGGPNGNPSQQSPKH